MFQSKTTGCFVDRELLDPRIRCFLSVHGTLAEGFLAMKEESQQLRTSVFAGRAVDPLNVHHKMTFI